MATAVEACFDPELRDLGAMLGEEPAQRRAVMAHFEGLLFSCNSSGCRERSPGIAGTTGDLGTCLLRHLEWGIDWPILIGTWAAAVWVVAYYEKAGRGNEDRGVGRTAHALLFASWPPCSLGTVALAEHEVALVMPRFPYLYENSM